MIREAISKVVTGHDLNEEEMVGVMNEIMSGESSPAQIGSFITALRMKGETVDEITGAARVMREKAEKVDAGSGIVVDTCGTGGDSSGTFNVSTAAAFVVAGAGVTVAKHGNRSITSHCGSADVLEALGVNLDLPPEQVGRCIREVGIGFMFAPIMHGAMKHAIGPRREIGIRTVFNVLGPLTNPAGANVQVMGVFDPDLTGKLARVLGKLGALRAMVVCGAGNMDELTVTGETRVAEWVDNGVREYAVQPEDVGLGRAVLEDIRGKNDAAAAAEHLRRILGGEPGPCLDMVLLNAGAALTAAGKAADLTAGVELARRTVAGGAPLAKVDGLVAFSAA
ncbi:MAG: anthranilate phosphoribosyltransferase [Desulfurivibrionaceae bacterium]|nr:anthranilate phosphoribosyltransferase [Desulfobulbales bacterium]MDT8334730.1 anthranilate phosphoribosyltransferase [Desulfurivibrionaceae bacterium]